MYLQSTPVTTNFITNKEILDGDLSLKLRAQNIIKPGGNPFQESRKQEIEGLIKKDVFEFVPYDTKTMKGIRVLNLRFADEINGKATLNPFV
ncbi:hypothetical protein K3495_g15355 [Podosphaera aphanis]|nr:hypothetical protein K3495_g15355 [Podosphaera aphanis]